MDKTQIPSGNEKSNKMIKSLAICLFLTSLISCCNAPMDLAEVTKPADELPSQDSTTEGSGVLPPAASPRPPTSACPIPLGAPGTPLLDSPTTWAAEVLSYLNQGGSLTGLIEDLGGASLEITVRAAIIDINADGFEDFILNLNQAEAAPGARQEAALFVFLCDQATYRLAYAADSLPEARRLELYEVTDLTGDGIAEILWMQELCGAHTCSQAWEVLQWQSTQLINILSGRTDDLPSPILEIRGPAKDGSMILAITATGVQSAGAGPSRAVTRLWGWSEDERRLSVIEDRVAPPTFRIHAVHDADQAALEDDHDTALTGYLRVVEDPGLDDYPFGNEGYQRLSAYALFRIMLLWLGYGDGDQAASTLRFLKEGHTPGSPGEGYSLMAEETWEAFQAQQDLGYACQIAQAYALTHPEGVLEPLNYGYANRTYAARDICPYTQ